MKKIFVLFFGFTLVLSTISCNKRGCKTSYAKNYDSSVKKDNNTCEYYYKANVTGIKIMNFPDLDPNGNLWDSGSLPDLYIRFTNHEDEIKYQTQKISNIAPSDTISWVIPSFVVVDTASSNTQFKIYEVDDASARLIEKIPVEFKDFLHESKTTLTGDKYPDSVKLNTSSISMMIYLNWVE